MSSEGDGLPGAKPNLLRRLRSRVRSQLGLPGPWVRQTLLGHELVIRDGTLWHEPDYDDAWLHACARHAQIVFDVGANVGQSSLVVLMSPAVKHVVLIDANWEALSVAAENLIRNHLSSKAVFVTAFAADKGQISVDFWTVGTGAAGSMFQGHAVSAARGGSVRRVPTVTLDELADRYGWTPDLIKIDVEGAESRVLQGSVRCAAHRKSRFLVEMHSPPELPMHENANAVLEWAASVRYAVWYLSTGQRIETPKPIQHRGRCHLLLQPEEWEYPEFLAGIKQSSPLPRL